MVMKIISAILAFIMSILGLAPAVPNKEDCYTQAEWYVLVASSFGLTDNDEDKNLLDAEAAAKLDANTVAAVEACYDWGVIVDEFKAEEAVTDYLVARSLAVATGAIKGSDANNSDKVIEVAGKFFKFEFSFKFDGQVKAKLINKTNADSALKAALDYREATVKPASNGGTLTLANDEVLDMSELSLVPNGEGFSLMSENGEVTDEDVKALDYEGSARPFDNPETAGVGGQSLKDSIKGILADNKDKIKDAIIDVVDFDFDIGKLNVGFALADTGFDVSVGGNIKGANISKKWEVRNFEVLTKFDGNIAEKQINHAYLIMNYDLTDNTEISGSAAYSVAEKELPEGTTTNEFLTRVQNNLFELTKGSNSEITLFSVDVAIPHCPAITVGIVAKIVITFDGRVVLSITSEESHGIEVIDNKARTISEQTPLDTHIDAQARLEGTIAFNANLKCVSICIIDVEVKVGLGVHVTVLVDTDAGNYKLDMPYDFLADVYVPYPTGDSASIYAKVNAYGIVHISIGQNSILKKIGLKKTWKIVDEDGRGKVNGTFYTYETAVEINKAA